MGTLYENSGVNQQEARILENNIKNINSNISRFAGVVNITQTDCVTGLATTCDGIGSKVMTLYERKLYNNIAKDLIAVNMNNLACSGAKLVGFSDYIAVNKLESDAITGIVNELNIELQKYNCPLLGGETSEVNSLITKNQMDICGFSIGINPIKKEKIVSGDIVIGLSSSGIHTNGFSLIRKLYHEGQLTDADLNECLKPSHNYYNEIIDLYNKGKIKDCANITAGGIYANLNRILPKGLKANLNLKHIPKQPIYEKLYQICGDEMYDVFNAGIGFCMVAERASNEIFFEDCQKYNPIVLGVIE